ncbi:RNA polymerase II degradation factor 1 [Thalassophryne amazonica]|uniref:RNA polymerase II degradation factor 1 n=1 Tax=Thalassophryne amazonica TaxID=390379 RepID=UPI0014725CB9|nr:RNA polymerase II degradation factor 1 [Thalassophryne amazonica]XP_034034264.1 RNA polymerase II degradation factor 1 [Thalassophryne amazonica]
MVMTCHQAPSTALLVLLVLLTITPQLADAAPVWGDGGEGGVEGRTRTDRKEDSLATPFLPLPLQTLSSAINASSDRGRALGQESRLDQARDPAQVLAVLLEAMDHPEEGGRQQSKTRDWEEGQSEAPLFIKGFEGGQIRRMAETQGARRAVEEEEGVGVGTGKGIEQLIVGHLTAVVGGDFKGKEEENKNIRSAEDRGLSVEAGGAGTSEEQRKEEDHEQQEGNNLESFLEKAASQRDDPSLQRKIRGYFQNIDLGLQDNEILPPLKGYKAYNTQLARAGKKLHWQDNEARDRPVKGGNFMDDFEDEGEELEEEVEEEEESLSQMEEEARARAEKQEVLRQQEEAERAREEEQRLADIASDMVLQYMGRKQQSYMKPRQKSSTGAASNTAEDKRSEEVISDEDDMDQQMIDRLIEISSKLHLPADDVIEIISDVEEKKKKRKELQQQPSKGSPVAPRFRPLVPPPVAAPPMYHYTASKNTKKVPYKNKSNKKWHKDKVKSYKQDYWYKPQKQLDYWYKPQKQFLAFPSYPYYQKPYRAYYPVYFPYPKSQYYGKPFPSRDQTFGPQELDLQAPRQRPWSAGKNRVQGWRQPPVPRLPLTPYISNYILPHPRTYQPLPPPKPITTPRRGRRPPYYYQHVTPGDDYEEDGLVPQLDSEEELENFIERIYMKRRMY